MLEAAEADLALEAGFCPGERRARAFPEIWSLSSSTRTNGFGLRDGSVRSCRSPPDAPSSTEAAGPNPPLDMLMTLQGVYEKSFGTPSPSPRRAPRWTRSG